MKYKYFFYIVPLLFLYACSGNNSKAQAQGCIPPADKLSYNPNVYETVTLYPSQSIMPPQPWIAVANLPNPSVDNIAIKVEQGNSEIWLSMPPAIEIEYNEYRFFVSKTNDLEFRSLYLHTTYGIGGMYFAGDDSIWIHNTKVLPKIFFNDSGSFEIISPQDSTSNNSAFPTLSKYSYENETEQLNLEQSFVFQPDTSSEPSDNRPEGQLEILLDPDGIFWILAPYDGIYSFSPLTKEVKKHADLINIMPVYAAMGADKKIYFTDYNPTLIAGNLFMFDINGDTLEEIDYFLEPWPAISNLKVDNTGRLWAGALGWREPDGEWKQLIRQPIFVTQSLQDPISSRWQNPFLLIESSDGRLWFRSDNGLAWLDLRKEEWCWFTTYQSNIVEDSEHNLWMIADGKLYKYALGAE